MPVRTAMTAAMLIFGLAACDRPVNHETQRDRDEKTDEHMRQAGRSAYEAAQKAQGAAEDLSRLVERAGKEAREGWDEAKREHEQGKK